MTADYLVECSLQCINIELAVDADDLREIVERTAGLQLVQEPETLLRKRDWKYVSRIQNVEPRRGTKAQKLFLQCFVFLCFFVANTSSLNLSAAVLSGWM